MKNKYFSLILALGLFFAFAPQEVHACLPFGTTTLEGPSYCEDGVEASVPARYEANYTSQCSGCESLVWEVTGGTFVDQDNIPLLPFEGGEIKIAECDCKFEDFTRYDLCFPILGSLASNDNVMFVRWNPNATVQEIKVKGASDGGSATCESDDKILYKRITAPTGIQVNSTTCTQANVTAQISSNDCRPPDFFRWYRNGSLFATSTSPTRSISISSSQSTTIEVGAVYGVSESARASVTVPPSVVFPNGISGNAILPEARPYFYHLGTEGTVTQWVVSSTNVTITSTGSRSARLDVINFVDGSTFTISARLEICGQFRWFYLDVKMDSNCSGPDCDFIRPEPSKDISPQIGVNTSSVVIPEPAPSFAPGDLDNLESGLVLESDLASNLSKATAFPNPISSGETLTIQSLPEEHVIQLFNLNGQLMRTIKDSGRQNSLYTNDLQSGIYVLTILDQKNPEKLETMRIIIQ